MCSTVRRSTLCSSNSIWHGVDVIPIGTGALGGTGDIRAVALCRHACARSHGVPFCCVRPSNAAAAAADAAAVAAAAAVFSSSPHCRTAMADSASESDTDGAGSSSATPMSSSASNSGKPSIVISQFRLEELTNRLASLQQENKVLKIELETFKLKCKALQEENRDLRKASVTIVSNGSRLTTVSHMLSSRHSLYRVCQQVSLCLMCSVWC